MNLEDMKTLRLLCMQNLRDVERTAERMHEYGVPPEVLTSIHHAVAALYTVRTRLDLMIRRLEGEMRK